MNGKPWSLTEIEHLVPQVFDQLDDAVSDLKQLGIEAATKTSNHKKSRALAMLAAIDSGAKNQDERDSMVTRDTQDEWLVAELAERAYNDQRTVINVLRSQGDLLRTMAVSRRESAG